MAITFVGSATGPVIIGNSATTQNLLTVENRVGSRVNVNIRRLMMQLDPVAVLTAVMPIVRTSRASSVSGGAIYSKSSFSTTYSSDANVVVSGAVGDQFPITATAGTTVWQQYANRFHTIVEQSLSWDNNMLPLLVADTGKEFTLRPGESLVVQVVAAAGTSNALNMNNWFSEVVWEEDSIGEFPISGTVTLSGSPVAGAKISVVESDDLSLTNPVYVGVETTDASGNWASSIKSGKIGAAFVQYESGGTLYTAPGSPFLQP